MDFLIFNIQPFCLHAHSSPISTHKADMIGLAVDTLLDTKFGGKKIKLSSWMLSRSRERLQPNFPSFLFHHVMLLGYQLINRLNFYCYHYMGTDPAKKIHWVWILAFKTGESTVQGKFLLNNSVFLVSDVSYVVVFLPRSAEHFNQTLSGIVHLTR